MDGFAISVASKVAEYLVGPIVRPFRYIWNYNNNFENLENEVKKLEGRRETVQHLVVDATRKGDEIFEHVQDWLESANQIIDEAYVVIEDNKKANLKCCKGLCPNPKKCFQLSKQVVKKAEAVAEVHEVGTFGQVVSYHTVPEETWLPSINGYEAFNSRIPTLNNVLHALSDPDVNMVGVYGMGSIGKTTLAKEVARQAKEGTLFKVDEIVFVEVSEKPDIEKIQGVIADKLGLVFTQVSEFGRARKLCERLKKEKSILIVLDNIWGSIDLETVGIPYGDNHKGCKLLLTARSRDVLSNQMGSQKNFSIDVLNAEEAWSLFKKTVGACIEQHELQSVAVDVANTCGGMPIAIVTTAKALRNKRVCEWNNALRQLTMPSLENFEGVAAKAYLSIQLSYDHLGVELKSTFLLCSMMEHTWYDSPVEYLLRYGIGLGLYRNVNTMEGARDRVDTLVEKLKDSSLLLDTPDNQRFSMHDVVRDVARSIAFRDHHAFTVTNGSIPRDWTDENVLKYCTEIFLHDLTKIPEELECPQLKCFYMKTKNRSSKIPDRFFTGMSKLRVLHLIEMDLSPLPTSFSLLVNLRTLCFDECQFGDIAVIGELKKLEILSFFYCCIEQLCKEMDQLSQLRLFDLSFCYYLKVFPPNVISSLTQLEELYLGSSFTQWEVDDEQVLDTGVYNASLNELKQLPHLTALEIEVQDANILPIGLFFEKLERYRICIGDNWHECEWRKLYETSRTLKLDLSTRICLEDGVIAQLKGIRDLYLDGISSFRNVYELHNKGFLELKYLNVKNNPNFLSIADPDAFPLLESLYLSNLVNLKKIHNGQLSAQSFHQLKTIEVRNCDKLKNIFSFSIARGLPQLQEVKVIKCKNMEKIFVTEREDVSNNKVSDNIQLNQLRFVALKCLPELISFYSKVKTPSLLQMGQKLLIKDHHELDNPPLFFNEKVLFPNLEALELYVINSEKIWHQQHPTMSSSFNNLKRLIVKVCLNLKYLFSSSIVRNFVLLQHLEVWKCDTLEELIVKEESRSDGEGGNIKFPQLAYLKMECLQNLKRFSSGNYIEFPSLKQMEIRECPEMKAFILNDEVAFPNLEEMEFNHMDNLKIIWHNQVANDSFMNLKSVKIENCKHLSTVFPSYLCERLSRLETLNVTRCGSLVEIFDLQGLNIIEEAHSMTSTQLRKLNLSYLPKLKHVWNLDPKGLFSFQNLCKVEVSNCGAMKNLFPASFSKSDLLHLEQLSVSYSGVEEIVVAKEEGSEAETAFVFPRLTYLSLCDLHELRCFYQGVHNAKWPVLEYLQVHCCDKIEILLASEFPCLQENSQQGNSDMITTQQPFFLVEKGFPNLKDLKISGKAITAIWQGQYPENFFHKLNFLKVYVDESAALPLGPLQRFQNLENLTLSHCSYKEIFLYGEVDKHARALPHIKCLTISGLGDLKQDFILDLSLQNLTILKVKNCGRMINLLTSSAARSLVQLREMSIKDCNTMLDVVADVVANDGDITGDDEIVFSQLVSLTLECLSSLTSFCSGNYTIKFPSLETLIVEKCPKMEIFSLGVLSMPRLRKSMAKQCMVGGRHFGG